MSALERFPADARELAAEIIAAKAAYASAIAGTTEANEALARLAMLKANYRDAERAALALP